MRVKPMICDNCDNRFDMVVDGDKYWVKCPYCKGSFCRESCHEEFQDREGIVC